MGEAGEGVGLGGWTWRGSRGWPNAGWTWISAGSTIPNGLADESAMLFCPRPVCPRTKRKVSVDASPDRGVRSLDEASHGRGVPRTIYPLQGWEGLEMFTLKNTVQTILRKAR